MSASKNWGYKADKYIEKQARILVAPLSRIGAAAEIVVMRKNKFNAKKATIDGITFHSEKEGRRYLELKLLQTAGHISNLELQPRYDFELNGVKMGFYKADFRYLDRKLGEITEDAKGCKTPIYNLRKKMMLAFHGIDILET